MDNAGHLRIVRRLFTAIFSVVFVLALGVRDATSAPQDTSSGPTSQPTSAPAGTETIVIFRHGEKPANGLGQITPQGFNRALALSELLPRKFGKPDCLFAPDPREKVKDRGGEFNYIRPLATIEPLAIRLGMDVHTPCGFTEIAQLEGVLTDAKYADKLIFVAWEHVYARKAAFDLVQRFGGDTSPIPDWPGKDYDSLYVIKIHRAPGQPATAAFTLDHEGLDNQSPDMPSPAQR